MSLFSGEVRVLFRVILLFLLALARGAEAAPLSAYLDWLQDPALQAEQPLREETLAMLKVYAPRLWFHPDEKYGPSDPMTFVAESSLWYRHLLGKDARIAARGQIIPEELGLLHKGLYSHRPKGPWFETVGQVVPAGGAVIVRPHEGKKPRSGEGFYLKFEGSAKTSKEAFGALTGSVPIFWKLGEAPLTRSLRSPASSGRRVLLEFWYHLAFSKAGKVGLADHQGEWEGFAILVDLDVDSEGKLTHQIRAAFYAAHGGGTWHCPSELSWAESDGLKHPEAFSALGTHATFHKAGKFSALRGLFKDVTSRGHAWNTWKLLRPIVMEPYYGYSGAWGSAGLFKFSTGPLVPGPSFKSIPRENTADGRRIPAAVATRCGF